MPTEPWGRLRWVGLERACEACIRAAGLVEETGRSGVAPDHGLITIRLADQPVPMTELAERAARVAATRRRPAGTALAHPPVLRAPRASGSPAGWWSAFSGSPVPGPPRAAVAGPIHACNHRDHRCLWAADDGLYPVSRTSVVRSTKAALATAWSTTSSARGGIPANDGRCGDDEELIDEISARPLVARVAWSDESRDDD